MHRPRPISASDEPTTVPAIELPTPIAARKLPLAWLGIAAAAVLVVAAVSVELVSKHTQVASSTDQGTPEASSAPSPKSEATTALEPPKVEQFRPANEAVAGQSATASTTPDVASTAANTLSNAPVSPAPPRVSASPNVVTDSKPPAAVQEVAHPPASAPAPVESAPQPAMGPTRTADTTPPSDDLHRGQPVATPSAPSPTANDTQAAPPARPPETTKLETPAVPPAVPSASVDTSPGPTQPVAAAPTTPPAVPPLPIAPPPVAALPVIPPPAATPPMVPPPTATPPMVQPPAATPPMVQPPAAQSPSTSSPHDVAPLPPGVIAVLLQRGSEKLASGDILSARLLRACRCSRK